MNLLKAIRGWLRDIWDNISSALRNIYDYGLANLFKEKRYFKFMIDLGLVVGWWYALAFAPLYMVTSILGVTFIVSILTKALMPSGNTLAGDMVSPFIAIAVYTASASAYWWIAEVAFFAGILIIPALTREIQERYHHYLNEHEENGGFVLYGD